MQLPPLSKCPLKKKNKKNRDQQHCHCSYVPGIFVAVFLFCFVFVVVFVFFLLNLTVMYYCDVVHTYALTRILDVHLVLRLQLLFVIT